VFVCVIVWLCEASALSHLHFLMDRPIVVRPRVVRCAPWRYASPPIWSVPWLTTCPTCDRPYLNRGPPHLREPARGDVRRGERGVEGEEGVVQPVLSFEVSDFVWWRLIEVVSKPSGLDGWASHYFGVIR